MRIQWSSPLRWLMGMTLCLCLAGHVATSSYAQGGEPPLRPAATLAPISEPLRSEFAAAQGPLSFLVIMQEQVDAAATLQASNLLTATRVAKTTALYAELTTVAQRTQAPIYPWLDEQGLPYRPFYLVNMIEVRGDSAAAEAIRSLPGVGRVVANPAVGQQFGQLRAASAGMQQAIPYGLQYTQATELWKLGYRGQGIVIASQDTGVEWDHPALQAQYRGVISDTVAMTTTIDHQYNWFDAWPDARRPARCDADLQVPCDDHGHGTHTVGTMIGDASALGRSPLGMAPDAQWIGCRNMDHGVGTPSSYTACFEFFFAPYPQSGDPLSDGQPALAPDIINNSWGCPPAEGCDAYSLQQVVETVRAAGQMVVASAGNSGPRCNSVSVPIALYDAVFTVGAHDSIGTIAGFSSRGPVSIDGSNRRKPDLVAPGVGVYSSMVNHAYATFSGTSMAAPHVAGAVALLWSAVPTLTGQIDPTEQVLLKSAVPVEFAQCADGTTPVVPNHTYGFGRLDVLAAVELAQQPSALSVQVVDGAGAPVAGLAITVTDQLTGYRYPALTDAQGQVAFAGLLAGEYRLTTAAPTRFAPVDLQVARGDDQTIEVREVAAFSWQLFFPWIESQEGAGD